MANLQAKAVSQTEVEWSVTGFEDPWNSTYYQRVILSSSQLAVEGGTTGPNNVLTSISAPSSGSSTSTPTQTTTGGNAFSAGNPYTLYATALRANGRYWRAGSETVLMFPPPTPTMNPATIMDRLQGSIGLSWNVLSGASLYYLEYKQSSSSSWIAAPSTSNTFIYLYNMGYGIQYDFRIRASLTSGGYSNYSFTTSGTSQPKTPAISGQVTNGTTFTIYVSGMQGNWDSILVERLTSTGAFIESKSITPNGNQYVQWLNMPAGTNNRFRARSTISSLYSPYSNEEVLQNLRPQNFAWTYAKNANQPFNLTASEWNALGVRINEFRTYRGKTQYGFTPASTGDPFYAWMFNQAVLAIGGIDNPAPIIPPPSLKEVGDSIYASDINKLRDSINSVT